MRISLENLINIKQGEVISVVGSGGKTTFVYNLANELKDKKVVISTTTKMFFPNKNQVDYFFRLDKNDEVNIKNGRTFIAVEKVSDNKVSGDILGIKKYISDFDYIILESDGSKRKPLKGWNDTEPVILNETTKTIGIIPMHIIGEKISEENIHRIEIFNEICKCKIGDEITPEIIAKIIKSPKGLFKNSIGEKILFLNRIEDEKSKRVALNLLEILGSKSNNSLKIIGGSLRKKEYFNFSIGGD